MDTSQKQQIADRLTQSNNILVTVSTNPSVDQLAACLGLTLALNKMGKHAAAVFSGQVPSTIEFLQPEKTLEKNTDSLRDFIISLDKSKADKLRYKVEDKVVKIFITPYKTSISEKDFEFSQGDFNVDVVVALGVHSQADVDQAITAHGRILHDAVVATLNIKPGGALGGINLVAPAASSLSELVVTVLDAMNKKVLDTQISTALLTGIVAETQRFSNAKTSPQTMTVSAELMAAGANQQLVATKLEPPKLKPAPPLPTPAALPVQPKPAPAAAAPLARPTETPKNTATEGTFEIDHDNLRADGSGGLEPLTPQIDIDREGTLRPLEEMKNAPSGGAPPHSESQRMILQPPSLGGQLTANAFPESGGGVSGDPLSLPQPGGGPLDDDEERPSGAPPADHAGPQAGSLASFGTLSGHQNVAPPTPMPALPPTNAPTIMRPSAPPLPSAPDPIATTVSDDEGDRTLSQIEQDVDSPHAAQDAPSAGLSGSDADAARNAVSQAINSKPGSTPLEPIAALNAQPVHLPLRDDIQSAGGAVIGPSPDLAAPADPNAPPPVPPPMMPPSPQ